MKFSAKILSVLVMSGILGNTLAQEISIDNEAEHVDSVRLLSEDMFFAGSVLPKPKKTLTYAVGRIDHQKMEMYPHKF